MLNDKVLPFYEDHLKPAGAARSCSIGEPNIAGASRSARFVPGHQRGSTTPRPRKSNRPRPTAFANRFHNTILQSSTRCPSESKDLRDHRATANHLDECSIDHLIRVCRTPMQTLEEGTREKFVAETRVDLELGTCCWPMNYSRHCGHRLFNIVIMGVPKHKCAPIGLTAQPNSEP